MKSRGLLIFRIAVAITLCIACLAVALSIHSASADAPIWTAFKMLFSALWIIQAYFLLRQLKLRM